MSKPYVRPHAPPATIHERELTWLNAQMNNFMENCFAKGAMSGVMGFGMGGLFGMFMASVRRPLVPSLLHHRRLLHEMVNDGPL